MQIFDRLFGLIKKHLHPHPLVRSWIKGIFTASSAVRVSFIYALVGFLWILFSDRILGIMVKDESSYAIAQTYKGWAFVLSSAVLIYWLLRIEHAITLKATEKSRHAERELQESELRYRSLFQNNYAVMLILDPETGNIVDANPAAAHYYGWSLAELRTKNVNEINLLTPEEVRTQINQVRSAQSSHFLFRHRHADGSLSDVEVFSGLITIQSRELLYSIVHDITKRKQAEDALRESEEYLRLAYTAAMIGIWKLDLLTGEVHFDERARQQHGLLETDLAFAQFLKLVHTEDVERLEKAIAAACLPGGSGRFVSEYRITHPDGAEHWLSIHARVSFDNGQYASRFPILCFCTCQDFTQRKLTEQQIRDSLSEHETLLRELYHRTKNNMAVIIALLDLQAGYFDDDRLQKAFMEAKNRIHSMAMVHQKLYDAKDLSHINLKEYTMDLVQLLMDSYYISPAKIAVVFEMQDVFILIDSAIPCGLILNELISNALKYAFVGNTPGEIKIQLSRTPDGEINLRVADNGVGVPPGFDFSRDGHLGTQNIVILTRDQLRGEVTFDTSVGVACHVRFHDIYYESRV